LGHLPGVCIFRAACSPALESARDRPKEALAGRFRCGTRSAFPSNMMAEAVTGAGQSFQGLFQARSLLRIDGPSVAERSRAGCKEQRSAEYLTYVTEEQRSRPGWIGRPNMAEILNGGTRDDRTRRQTRPDAFPEVTLVRVSSSVSASAACGRQCLHTISDFAATTNNIQAAGIVRRGFGRRQAIEHAGAFCCQRVPVPVIACAARWGRTCCISASDDLGDAVPSREIIQHLIAGKVRDDVGRRILPCWQIFG
jgi:hypothetical protein